MKVVRNLYTKDLFLVSFILLISCGKTTVDYHVKGEFVYYNRLSVPVQVRIRAGLNKAKEDHTIAPGASLSLYTDGMGSKVADPKGYVPGIVGDTTVIQFNDTLCYGEYNSRGPILHSINSYTYEKRGDADYVFYFDIDSNLVKKARRCD